jgi:hypothetical protein
VLTSGPDDPDYFEHALIGRYLGYPVVESADLTVRDNRVFLKTLEGLERVDVIVRRIASDASDPLELRSVPGIGIAGLLQAARSGNVLLANAIGSGVCSQRSACSPSCRAWPGICWARSCRCRASRAGGAARPRNATSCSNADKPEPAPRLRARSSMLTAGAHEFAQSDPELSDPEDLKARWRCDRTTTWAWSASIPPRCRV